jgi:hypothetical protein
MKLGYPSTSSGKERQKQVELAPQIKVFSAIRAIIY